jgi:HTH-type transcriptional regulator/antitoxin HipB
MRSKPEIYAIATMNKNNVKLAEVIKNERERLKLTQQELAAFSNCGITFINQLEQGKSTIRFDKLMQVLQALGMSLTITKGSESVAIKVP